MIQFANPATGQRYADIQSEIDRRFPAGRFVAMDAGTIVADAETHPALLGKLHTLGKSPKDMVILQAGIQYPASAVIFASVPGQQPHA